MQLYMFEHCFLCFRIRMVAALKSLPIDEIVVLEDDTECMVSLVGRRQVPILVREDGSAMLESMDIARFLEGIGEPVLTGPERPEIADWEKAAAEKAAPLTQPRYPLLGLREFSTAGALAHYVSRKRKTLGDLAELRAKTHELIEGLGAKLAELDGLIQDSRAVNGRLSYDDLRVLPLLRSAAVVKALRFPANVQRYFDTMMESIGHRPLPSV